MGILDIFKTKGKKNKEQSKPSTATRTVSSGSRTSSNYYNDLTIINYSSSSSDSSSCSSDSGSCGCD